MFGGATDLRNFGYCILTPDGSTRIRESRRGPNYVYPTASAMAEDLNDIAKRYSKKRSQTTASVPLVKDVRLALNVASCDGLPCVIVFGENKDQLEKAQETLGRVCWSKKIVGKFIYATCQSPKELKLLAPENREAGFLVVKPNPYGTEGELIRKLDLKSSEKQLTSALSTVANQYRRTPKSHNSHVRTGRRKGIEWETEVEVPKRSRRRNR